MNAYRTELLNIMEEAAQDLTDISFRYECLKHNIKHARTDDCLTVGRAFCRRHPEYKMIFLTDPRLSVQSAFTMLCLTMNDYDDGSEYGKEV